MKIDKDKLRALSEKGDEELWREIQRIAGEHGYKLPVSAPKHEDMERIRGALSGAEKISLGDAARIMNSFKKKE